MYRVGRRDGPGSGVRSLDVLLRAPALFVDGGVHLGGDDTLLAHGGKHSALKKICIINILPMPRILDATGTNQKII
jgi:hypothetical protein